MSGLNGSAGFRPTKKQPIPGTKLLWARTTKLTNAMTGIRIYRTVQENLRDQGGRIALC